MHGVGDQRQRVTIHEFLRSLARLKLALPSEQQTLREPGTADEGFSYFFADSKLGKMPVTFAEFFWADRSRISGGFLSILRNFLRLIVDVPDIIYACLGPNTAGDRPRDYFILRCLRAILALTLWIIYFPIIAVNVVYAILVGGFALQVRYTANVDLTIVADLTVVLSVSLAIFVIFILLRLHIFNKYFQALAINTIIILVSVLALSAYNLYSPDTSLTFRQYSKIFQDGLNFLWLIAIVVSLIYLLMLPILILFFWGRRRGILLGFATTFLVIRFWLLLITTIWLVFLTSIFDQATYSKLIGDIGGPIRFLSLLWFDIAVIGIALLTSLAQHIRSTRAAGGQITGTRYPRLIVPASVPGLALILAVFGLAIISACNCSFIFSECANLQCHFVDKPTEWIIANAATLLAGGGLIIQLTHSGFEVALDIVSYFRSDRGHRRINPFSAVGSVFNYQPEGANEFRPRLRARLDALVSDLNQHYDFFNRIVLVAHSLGSLIAIDLLKDLQSRGVKIERLDLITLGSPYTEICNYYFPHMFAAVSAQLLPNVTKWSNIYSENDYVGTALTDGKSGVFEVVRPPVGHVHYLDDDDVVGEIARHIVEPQQSELTA